MKKRLKNGLIKVLIFLAVLSGMYCLWCHFLTDNVIWKKVKINGVSIQGMTTDEAKAAVLKDFQEKYENTKMTVTLNGKEFSVAIYPILGIDIDAIIEEAYSLGHGAWLEHGTDRIWLMNSGSREEVTVMPTAQNREKLDAALEESGIQDESSLGKFRVVPDMDALKEEILSCISSEQYDAAISCPVTRVRTLSYADLLGTYTTYGGGTEDRITNLKLAVAACNGIQLQPGQIFSYNDTLGPRTAERGYKDATVIVNGEYETGIGGGICQISTTLFMACLNADLTIVERYNHAARVDYVDDGLDAAVVWEEQDFRFRNNLSYPVKITAAYDEKEESVTVSIYGIKENTNTVEITTEQSDADTCRTYRSVYNEAGELLRKEEVAYSHYKQ